MEYKEEVVRIEKDKVLILKNEEVKAVYKLIGKLSEMEIIKMGLTKDQSDLLQDIYSKIFHYPRRY